MQDYGYGMHYGGAWLGMHWFWWIFWLLVVALFVWFLVRTTGGGAAAGPGRGPDAEDVLRDRFARGEISEEEYRSRLRVLNETRR